MGNEPRSVFERLDDTESKLDSIDAKISELLKASSEAKPQKESADRKDTGPTQSKPVDAKESLHRFVRFSKKEYLWLGPDAEFRKAKSLLCLNALAMTILGVFPTIFTAIVIGFYSPFSVLENIWFVFSIVLTVYAFNFKARMSDADLKSHSCENFKQDADGTWRIYSEKKSFIWFRRLSNLSCVANIIMAWSMNQEPISIVSTIFEIILFGLSIASIFSYSNLFCMYGNFILYTNKNNAGDQVALVFDVMGKKLITYDDFKKKYGKILG